MAGIRASSMSLNFLPETSEEMLGGDVGPVKGRPPAAATGTVELRVMVAMLEAMHRSRSAAEKRKKFRKFMDYCCPPRLYFPALRLLLPSLDRQRGSYGLKESVLATSLVDALAISRDSDDALRLLNWRKGGPKAGANVGNFALVASEVLQRRQGTASGGLTIEEVNDLLDRLATGDNRGEKTAVLSELIRRTNAREMKWIVMVILKDLKLGISERSIFHEFHPDAEALFNVTCDLKLVCEKLQDRTQRHKRQDIEVGKPVRPQLAIRVGDPNSAWKKLHGKQVLVECKFDGDRIQIHKSGSEIHFFSRNFIDHPEYGHSMAEIIFQNVLPNRCILDGEMLVWDKSTNRFAEFGSNQEIAKAAKEGFTSDRQLCYVAFDILYANDTSVIHQSLKERHELLQNAVRPLKGRLEILVPNVGLNTKRSLGEPCWSLVALKVEDVETFFKETIDNRDEGIVLKDYGSKWDPGDRSGKWLKLKPDYIHAGSDLDVLIIGGYFGSGRQGGEVAQFLVGLADRSMPNTYPKRFISFCRVGTGLSNDELDTLITKLKPYFRKNEYPKKAPSFYEVTNNAKERPDVWIESPEKSIILSITSDIRTIESTVFAAPYSLRFPRIDRVRYDKPWHECLDVQSFVEFVHSNNGNAHGGAYDDNVQSDRLRRIKPSRKGDNKIKSLVPSNFLQTDITDVTDSTGIFTNLMFYFVNVPSSYNLESFHKMVVENGGAISMNLNAAVTHCIAAERKGIKYQAATLRGDVIHSSWLMESCSQKHLLHLQPKHFLFISDSTKIKLQEEIDEFADYYYWNLDIKDLVQLLSNMVRSEDRKSIDYYRRKYCPSEKWALFQDCCIYFLPVGINLEDLLELIIRRLKLEVSMGGGDVCNDLAYATHLVAFSTAEEYLNINAVFESLPTSQGRFLHHNRLQVVSYQWLEDSLKKMMKLPENLYTLKSELVEAVNIKSEEEKEKELPPSRLTGENKISLLPVSDTGDNRKKGSNFYATARNGRTGKQQSRPSRVRMRRRPSRIERSSESSEETCKPHRESEDQACEVRGEADVENNNTKANAAQETSCQMDSTRNADYQAASNNMDLEDQASSRDKRKRAETINDDQIEAATKKYQTDTDPVQAMLLDMIPSLGATKADSVIEKDVSYIMNPEVTQEAAATKKKVSYKDIAGELLKDF